MITSPRIICACRSSFFCAINGNAALAEYNHLDGVGRYRAFNPPALF
jgi:hypothetical protein